MEPVVSVRGYRGSVLTVLKCCIKQKGLTNSHPSHTGRIQELLKFKTIIRSEEILDGSKQQRHILLSQVMRSIS